MSRDRASTEILDDQMDERISPFMRQIGVIVL